MELELIEFIIMDLIYSKWWWLLNISKKLGAITPIGGVAFIAGWLAMAMAGL